MTFYVLNQNTVILTLAALGFLIGILFDILSAGESFFKMPFALVLLFDTIFCILSSVVFIAVNYVVNYGYIRWYGFASVFVGFSAYRIIFDRLFYKMSMLILGFLWSIVLYTVKLLVLPIILLVKAILSAFTGLFLILKSKLKDFLYGRYSRKVTEHLLKCSEEGFF